MNCQHATALIGAYADGETNRLQKHWIRRHLDTCPPCRTRHDELVALRARLRAEVPRYSAPAALRERIEATLGSTERGTRRSGSIAERWRWLTGGALAGCAATVLAWFAVTAVVDWRVNEDVAVEAVTSHVRATLGNQLIQVASSNRHTVKPWLSARLDYSPPVPDVQEEGFTLVGGRVDYLDHRPVATLVYRVRDHHVDVFVRPQSARAPPMALRTVRGFNVAHASGSEMDWLAVSDLSADALSAFVERLAAGEPAR
jgi:anti-sigma factor RsiW